ncbi:MAG: acetolactate synthase small subunit [Candidatus Kapabacteria bacterium]|jgi:acetolactate synthase-1/3 small subunit|nr:acetolactate synthase small subunit [Candidatus Kapabacteria bacterium]
MNQPKKLFTIIAFTENRIGLLNRITIIFTRRHINIESLTTSECEVEGVHRFTITTRTTEERAVKVVKQIEKLVEVIKASLHAEDETIYQELALYKIDALKIAADGTFTAFLNTLKKYNAGIQSAEKEYIIVQKLGRRVEIFMLLDALKEYHVLEFAKSGRVAMTRSANDLDQYLREMEATRAAEEIEAIGV